MGEPAPQLEYYVRAGRPAAVQPQHTPVAVADASTTGLLRELGGRVTWRKALRFVRLARILVPLAVALLGAVWRFGAEALERVPFLNATPAHHLGANGRLDPIDPKSLFVKSELLNYSPNDISSGYEMLSSNPSVAKQLTGNGEARGLLTNPAVPESMGGSVSVLGVWSDAIREGSFRDDALGAIGERIGDEPETVSVGGMEAYLFHVNKYPSYVFGTDFVVFFYEDQVALVAAHDARLAQVYANEVVSALP